MLFGTWPFDLVVFAAVSTTLLAVAGLACAVPAWRASRLDPLLALRTEWEQGGKMNSRYSQFRGNPLFRQFVCRFAFILPLLFLAFRACPSRSQSSSGTTNRGEQQFALSDTAAITVAGGKAESVEYHGRQAIGLTTQPTATSSPTSMAAPSRMA